MDPCPVCGEPVIFALTDKGQLVALEESESGCYCQVASDADRPIVARTLVFATGETRFIDHQD